ncbi:MAG: hypothetical protein OES24_18250 [Acidimicrobiia bacterium]|nr:hypothetical protein [Acidimicrobiia bacterium]
MQFRLPFTRLLAWAGLVVLLSATVACGDGDTTEAAESDTTEAAADDGSEETEESAAPESLERPTLPEDADPDIAVFEDFEAATFSNPTVIDNAYLPYAPGNRILLSGTTVEDGEEFAHQIRYVVTDLTKEILGVETVVVWIEDYSDDELVEAEIAFYAQDDAGNVWFFGEHPEEYEDEELIDAPTWIAGVDGAYPGIVMHADPQLDTPAYFQGWGPAVEWSDFAVVEVVGEEICIELGCFPDSITIAESSLDEEGIAQLKSYAPDVGNIEVGFRGDDATQEELEVVDHSPVSAEELASFGALAKALEASAYEVSAETYGATTPIE